ncbi:MAG: HEAT repeat domain-containing protein [Sedimentisphaerales bacterium]|nr:HEAT repeat domain-containing protein [Sedimentisphaerales bacterium]
MSQAQKIYEFFSQSKNPAADKALALALSRSESPYNYAIFETILERGHPAGTIELVEKYHLYPQDWQHLIHQNVDRLYPALRRTANSPSLQDKLNALSIIRRCRYFHLADLVVNMLWDQDYQVVRLANTVTLELAREWAVQSSYQDSLDISETNLPYHQIPPHRETDRQIMTTALSRAVNQFGKLHNQQEVVLAGMYFAPAHWQNFWENCFEPHHQVGRLVRRYLTNCHDPLLADFFLSALGNSQLRAVTARTLAQLDKPTFICKLTWIYDREHNDDINQGLNLVKKVNWLSPDILNITSLAPPDQVRLVTFISALNLNPLAAVNYVRQFINTVSEPALLKSMEIFMELPTSQAAVNLEHVLHCPHEHAAEKALAHIIRLNPKNLARIMIDQFENPHPKVRAAAQGYFRKIAFNSYWHRFDQLSRQEQITAGLAIHKIDPDIVTHWQKRARSAAIQDRMKAIHMARLLKINDRCGKALQDLAADYDRKVRSYAVAALGEIEDKKQSDIDRTLSRALQDKDERVRANAIEALEKRDAQQAIEYIDPLSQSPNSRIRANAIKALLNWKVDTARGAIDQMLHDPRTAHRRSAFWVVQQTKLNKLTNLLPRTTESSHVDHTALVY